MKKLNSSGFVLAETLIVTLFLMIIFTMIYVNYYPLIGEYEKREIYDDVDGKYVAYWIKRIVESDAYNVTSSTKKNLMNSKGYIRFECSDVSTVDNQQSMCINLVKSLEISNCDSNGNNCDAFITHYRIGGTGVVPNFKNTVNQDNTFKSSFRDYINYLPDYAINDTTDANYRVIVIVHHTKNRNDYYSFSTMEVNK